MFAEMFADGSLLDEVANGVVEKCSEVLMPSVVSRCLIRAGLIAEKSVYHEISVYDGDSRHPRDNVIIEWPFTIGRFTLCV